MVILLELMAVPTILLLCAWLCKPTRILTKLSALLLWVQVAVVAIVVHPALLTNALPLVILPEITVERLDAMFAILTQVVVASSLTHAHVFFAHDDAHEPENHNKLRLFYTCATLFAIAMTSVFFCKNLGLIWISVEATTLCSAPLIYFHRNKHALEAAWKYLMICSVGIAFALLGTMFIFASSQYGAVAGGSLNLDQLTQSAPRLQYPLLRLGFLFCLLGYGTKAGIFPLHSWLPDAHSEAPAPASAMLSGGLLNCALFAIWRVSRLVTDSGHQQLVQNADLTMGVITVVAASLLLVRQHGIKRLFAYSSIENVGLMLAAIGVGSGSLFLFLAINHSAAKVALFLISGNVIQAVGTKSLHDIHGLLTVSPSWALVLLLGGFAVTGAPPFGAFAAEWQLLANISQLHLWPALVALLFALAISFLAVSVHVGRILCGTPKQMVTAFSPVYSSAIPVGLIIITLFAGLTAVHKFLW